MINQKLSKFYLVGVFITAFLVFSCGSDDPEVIPPPPDPMGDMDDDDAQDDTRTYSTEQYSVGKIDIEIYLPSDYVEGNRYPTIYFNDGEFLADVFGSLTVLEAEPFIMVGLWDDNNRAARFSAYEDDFLTDVYGDFTPSAEAYTQSLVDEVIPFVEDLYPSSKRALFGISLGGLHATWAGINYPGEFAFIGALSPSFWVGNQAIFNESLEALRPVGISSQKVFYFDRGTAEWRNFMPMVNNFLQVELDYAQNIYYWEVIGAGHEIPFWLLRIETPFRLFMERNAVVSSMEVSGYCVSDLDQPGTQQPRINPIVTLSNGVQYSVMSAAEFEVVAGDGTVDSDGVYTINSGTSITVECRYEGFTDQVTVSACN